MFLNKTYDMLLLIFTITLCVCYSGRSFAGPQGGPEAKQLWSLTRAATTGVKVSEDIYVSIRKQEFSFIKVDEGKVLSVIALKSTPKSTLIDVTNHLFIGSEKYSVTAYDYLNGKQQYSIKREKAIQAVMLLAEKKLLIIADKGSIAGYRLDEGKKVWETTKFWKNSLWLLKVAVMDDGFIFSIWGMGGTINSVIIDADTGRVKTVLAHTIDTKKIPRTRIPVISGPFFKENRVFLGSAGISCVDLVKGKELWKLDLKVTESGGFFGTMARLGIGGGFTAVGMAATSTWADIIVEPVYLGNDRILVRDISGVVYCVNRDTGALVWKTKKLGAIGSISVQNETITVIGGMMVARLSGGKPSGPFGLKKLNPRTGVVLAEINSKSLINGILETGEMIFFADKDTLYSVDRKNLNVINKLPLKEKMKKEDVLGIIPTSAPGNIMIMSKKTIIKINLKSMETEYSLSLGRTVSAFTYSFVDGKLLLTTFRDAFQKPVMMHVLDIDSGKMLQVHEIGEYLPQHGFQYYGYADFIKHKKFVLTEDARGKGSWVRVKKISAYSIVP